MRKKTNIGALFLITVLALATIGMSYAGFTDTLTVNGTVETATVELTMEDFSGTDVWKVYGTNAPEGEIVTWHGFIGDDRPSQESLELLYPECVVLPVSSAWATPGETYDIEMQWMNIFPCIDFTADAIIRYTGTIPAHITVGDILWDIELYDFSEYTTFKAYRYYLKEDWIKGEEITLPVQVHLDEFIGIEMTIHLPQIDELQGLNGQFGFNIIAKQWNDACEDPQEPQEPECKILSLPSGPVTMKVYGSFPLGYGYFKTVLTNIPTGAYSSPIANNANLVGWCVDNTYSINVNYPYTTYLYDTYNLPTSLPNSYPNQPWMTDSDWGKVNWILNNKGVATPQQIQYAIWGFVDGGYYGSDPIVLQLMADANLNADFIPIEGQLCAAVCWVDASIHGHKQTTIIEVDP